MFTGLVQDLGTVDSQADGRLRVRSALAADLALGDSVAVNGVCLTATEVDGDVFAADVMDETFRRTSLGAATPGARVNLELPLRPAARLGGHLVRGHVAGPRAPGRAGRAGPGGRHRPHRPGRARGLLARRVGRRRPRSPALRGAEGID